MGNIPAESPCRGKELWIAFVAVPYFNSVVMLFLKKEK